MNRIATILTAAALAVSCSGGATASAPSTLEAPGSVSVTETASGTVSITWKDNASDEDGYYIFQGAYAKPVQTLPADSESCTVEGLKEGGAYYFGVQAFRSDGALSDLVRSEAITLSVTQKPGEKPGDDPGDDPKPDPDPDPQPDPNAPVFTVSEHSATSNYITVRYSIAGITAADPHGVVLDDIDFPGPIGTAAMQLLCNSVLEYGHDYAMRVYAEKNSKRYYSEPVSVSLGEEPAAITFNWTEVTGLGLPSAIKVYKTTDKLNGRNFNAWYAVADCSGSDVEFRVLNPSSAATLETQAKNAGDCYVLINGGIFGRALNGVAVIDGVQTKSYFVADDNQYIDRQYWGKDGKLHYISRGTFGVDASGKPFAGWSFTPSDNVLYLYDRPIPSVSGEALYPAGTATFPAEALDMKLYNAVSCGPVVLENGKVPVSLEKHGSSWFTNFEQWADDIYPTNPDRTSVGCTADGKIILFVCDGRISESAGAYVTELGQIMKGLGCVGAINLDGGGSTAMWAGGGRLNSLKSNNSGGTENRPVRTTLGFFKKR